MSGIGPAPDNEATGIEKEEYFHERRDLAKHLDRRSKIREGNKEALTEEK